MFIWKRKHPTGYEVSSKGDKRFSAFNAILQDGRSIEMHYQCDIKGYDPGGSNWRLGKGKAPLNKSINLLEEYVNLWRVWAKDNLPMMRELYRKAIAHDSTLTDCFASTEVNQAHALSVVLNELVSKGK